MIDNLILVFGLIGIGILSKRFKLLPEGTSHSLNAYVLNISLPAMILLTVPKLPVTDALIFPIVGHWVLYAINIGLILLVSKILNFKRTITGVLVVVSCLGNTAFLGIPVTETFFGSEAVPYAVLYDQLGSGFAFLFTVGVLLPIFKGGEITSIKNILKSLAVFPPFWALVIGLIGIKFPLPSLFDGLILSLSKTLIPCAMVAVGFQMKFKLNLTQVKPLIVGLGIKLIIIPIVALLGFSLIGSDHLSVNVSIIQSGMPPMVTAGALAINEDLEGDIAAGLVGYGLFLSFITIPILHYFL